MSGVSSGKAAGGGGGTASGGTPALVFDTTNAAGVATTFIREDDQLALFDATAPSTQAIGDSAATGSAAIAARRDHKHAMPAFATNAVLLGSAAAAGAAATLVRSDATIAAFDTTAPVNQAYSDAAAVGTAAFAARRDHKHGMPAGGVTADVIANRPAAGTAGRFFMATDQGNLLYFDTGSTWTGVGPGRVAATSDQTINNSNSLTNDAALSFVIGTSSTSIYQIIVNLVFVSVSTTSDVRFAFATLPAGATGYMGTGHGGNPTNGGSWAIVGTGTSPTGLTSPTTTTNDGGFNGTYGVHLNAILLGGGTAGTVQFQWAQQVATVENTVRKTGSHMIITQLAA